MNQAQSKNMWLPMAGVLLVALLLLGLGLYLVLTGEHAAVSTERPLPARKAADHAPDMVLIVLDALRADRVGAERNGVPLTPFLDRLRAEGAWFPDAVTACTWTRPAMASLFTSSYVETHEVVFAAEDEASGNRQTALPPDRQVLAALLQAGGYATAGVQTNGNLFPVMGFDRGFDRYTCSLDAPGGWVTQEALKAIPSLKSPFFLYAHYMDTHLPYQSPEEYRKLLGYAPEKLTAEEQVAVEHFLEYVMAWAHFSTGRCDTFPLQELSEDGKEAVRLLYDASVRSVDEEVRRLVEGVRARSSDALVIVMADHGEHFWDHNLLGHGLSLYNCELQVPLILQGGGVPKGEQSRLVETIDIAPTLLRLAGLPAPESWQGKDLFTAEARHGFARTQSDSPAWNIEMDAVLTETLKLVVDERKQQVLLFDRKADPEEQQNLAEERPEAVAAMKQLLHRQRAENQRRRTGVQSEVTVDAETLEQLRQLGYMH